MRASKIRTAALATCVLLIAPTLSACAAPSRSNGACPDVEVIFARGTNEAAGIGSIGQAFVDSLRSKIAPKSIGVYAVDYPATKEWPTAVDGVNDTGTHIEQTAAKCENTKVVLGGYSQGAAVVGFATSVAIPDGAAEAAPTPMPPDVVDHIAAIALFGTPSAQYMNSIGEPPIVIGAPYVAKTLELCAAGDPVCDNGGDWAAHIGYALDGRVDQGAAFAAGHL